jgi:DNA-binding transcriptional MerR regulator
VASTKYSDQDLARLYVVLTTNEGNVKRTARDTGFPQSTVRRYKQVWATEGPPKLDDVEQVVVEYVDEMERTRDLALQRMHERLEANQGTLPQIATVFGVLTDKIDRARGIGSEQTVHHKHSLPSPDEIRATLGAVVQAALVAHTEREEDIVDAEFIEQPPAALPRGTR